MNSRMSLLWVLREKHWSSGQLSFLDWWCPGILSWPIFLSCSKTRNNVSPHLIGRPMKLTAKITHLKPTFEGLEINSHCMGKLYTSSIDPSHSPSSTQRVPGRFSNPTLLCVEAKAQFPASKGPLFGLSFQISVSWAWTLLLLRTLMPWQQKALPGGLWP